MRVCLNCGVQLREDARFCKKCGTPTSDKKPFVNRPAATPVSAVQREEDPMKLSDLFQQMNDLLEKARLSYVQESAAWSAMVQDEKKKVQTVVEQIELLNARCAMLEQRLKETEEKNEILLRENAALQEGVSAHAETAMPEPEPELSDPVCPRCGEPITEEMVFCGNCGFRLIG